jgi:hypothetical protein
MLAKIDRYSYVNYLKIEAKSLMNSKRYDLMKYNFF